MQEANHIREWLRREQEARARRYPAAEGRRQPVHTVYGGAQRFRPDTIPKLGRIALRELHTYAAGASDFAAALGVTAPDAILNRVYQRVVMKLEHDPIEDFRIDFEDGYGVRGNSEEDRDAIAAAEHTADAMAENSLPPFFGIRIKPFTAGSEDRAIRTLDLYLNHLARRTKARLPANFVVTLPKVTNVAEPAALAALLEDIERRAELAPGSVNIEIMMETAQALLGPDGRCVLPELVDAAKGRCTGVHFGPFDFTSSCGITSKYQDLRHPACDYARQVMQVALAGTGVFLSDGPTHILPVPVHREPATEAQREENRRSVRAAWKLHFENVWNALRQGFYQGWDLHPAQLPVRFAAVYLFFLSEAETSGERLRNLMAGAAQAGLLREVFDDAASGQGLLHFFLRALNCGAITEAEVPALTGLSPEELRTGSFVSIIRNRLSTR